MPKTYARAYIPPQNIEPGSIDSANTPANTGAQQRVAKAEKIPKTKTEPAPCTFIFGCENCNEKWSPRSIDAPKRKRKKPPKAKIKLWYLLNSAPRLAKPRPRGKNTANNPMKNTRVISIIVRFCLKIEPK